MISVILLLIFASPAYGAESNEPKVEAQSAILIEADTGRILWEKNAHEPRPMASTTKIMTCILALESGMLDDIVTVSKRAALAPEVKLRLKAGEKQRLEDLLYALMMKSSNDAAVAIAEHISGSVEAFCEKMTQKAKELGAKNTVFRTPNGLDADGHQSTAYDLALITRYAMKNPKFVEIINTRQITIPKEGNFRSYYLSNANRFLYEYPGANGVKTGYTGKAGYCFVGAANQNGMQLISVVLASGWGSRGKEQKWVDTKRIMNYGFQNYKKVCLLEKNKLLKTIPVERAKETSVSLYSDKTIVSVLNEEEKSKVQIKIDVPQSVEAPVTKGQEIGRAKVILGDEILGTVSLVADRDIERHDFPACIKKVLNNWLRLTKYGIIIGEKE
ncbi:D-alanyl-D-alanine carboxypeptidase [Defluviitalea raffinosedens]|jgi:D-alanyl-D-alanine carboxypeptidase (penicillin-binding protein 5/6)|uniref:serine-type D-Ala-D-Ala carboxypeptidase n=2 Tax=Defluviitalea raffinosedens TaxID=1450156 RepID=A0A7C8HDA9_9FIRM|nr:D-alanyl-D-alanine carboxypeptidase [Defluviitalea raffinosedens]HHW67879.1 D-alanyl-D-alanine carboxypeptidase [Candidatus Epulonipiscium sp.]